MAAEWLSPRNWSEETKAAATMAVKAAAVLVICILKDNQTKSSVADFVTNKLPKLLE